MFLDHLLGNIISLKYKINTVCSSYLRRNKQLHPVALNYQSSLVQ